MAFLTNIFGDPNQRVVRGLDGLVKRINALEPSLQALAPADFPKRTKTLYERHTKGESLDDLLPEAFALVREAARRTLGQRHFDAQLLGGIILHQGKISEMRTGEGKTLVATLPAYLNAVAGKGVPQRSFSLLLSSGSRKRKERFRSKNFFSSEETDLFSTAASL